MLRAVSPIQDRYARKSSAIARTLPSRTTAARKTDDHEPNGACDLRGDRESQSSLAILPKMRGDCQVVGRVKGKRFLIVQPDSGVSMGSFFATEEVET